MNERCLVCDGQWGQMHRQGGEANTCPEAHDIALVLKRENAQLKAEAKLLNKLIKGIHGFASDKMIEERKSDKYWDWLKIVESIEEDNPIPDKEPE